jgi:hypothetical protein
LPVQVRQRVSGTVTLLGLVPGETATVDAPEQQRMCWSARFEAEDKAGKWSAWVCRLRNGDIEYPGTENETERTRRKRGRG